MVLTFWRDDIPSAAVITVCIVLYALCNALMVKYFGETEFWLAGGKLLLIGILFFFTFITMGPFVEYIDEGDLGRFHGFLAALWQAAFTIVGPEYLATVAGEAQRPRTTMKAAFKSVYWRFGIFFVGGALCVGIVLPANDPTLLSVLSSGETGTGAASPFVIAMKNMNVGVLPHFVNALLLTSIYSAGNAYVYCSSRSLYGSDLPYRGYLQPYGTWVALVWLMAVEIFYGYAIFLRGRWDTGIFFSNYTMGFLAICLFCGWKILKRTKFIRPEHADLVWIRPTVDEHEAAMAGNENEVGLRRRLAQMVRVDLKLSRASRSPRV
ncbi:hypothetical protein COL5a_003995 [Colletotrichum fioriniae]|nr:hypothetical protein COL5a_003995 [Colletotrichum fioriniae]